MPQAAIGPSPAQEDLRYPTDEDFAEENPGAYRHSDRDCEAMWRRIWKRWRDRTLCYEWFRYRQWYSLQAWEYAFTQLAKKKEEVYNPANLVRGIARNYEADPTRYQKQEQPADAQPPAPKPVQIDEAKRAWWEQYHARKRAEAARKTG